MIRLFPHKLFCKTITVVLLFVSNQLAGQVVPPVANTDTIPPMPSYAERSKNWGPNDTIMVDAIWYNREMQSYKEEPMVWVSKLPPKKLEKFIAEWTRLRNAVYVTYPYARVAGITINDINAKLANVTSKKQRKDYINSREKELKKTFSDPLSNLSVYQGKVLMKLIYRETGNNCYEIIEEYKGSFTAGFWQTVAVVFGSSLRQKYDPAGTDRPMESIVVDVEKMYGRRRG